METQEMRFLRQIGSYELRDYTLDAITKRAFRYS
jgi:hypothetical protein